MWHGVIAERVKALSSALRPTITKAGKRSQHTELMIAQVKATLVQPFGTEIPTIVLRILKDIPPESSLSRRELIVALRHILGTEYRSLFIPFLNDLLNFRVFMGTGITSFETCVIGLVYNTYTDLLQNIKSDLLGNHIKAILMNFAEVLNDPTASTTTQAMAGKTRRLPTIELSDQQQADAQEQLQNSSNRLKEEPLKDKGKGKQTDTPGSSDPQSKSRTERGRLSPPDRTPEEAEDILIERGKILGGVAAVLEPPFDHSKVSYGRRVLVRSCITSFQILFGNTKKMDAPLPDASALGRLLTGAVRCFGIYEHRRDGSRENEDRGLFCLHVYSGRSSFVQ
ncbi:hypothetical protein PGTUg99_009715 [Puccinia graminis f. sp. tritici]|uniref:Uncharacterized protein n=1 Tax=Puccinia graminis f. sp. tritici TaxID=56615 RepID=A0A5B0PPX9_PUCGR|nr:hypothetical protein PGTUg99_009715 [Puccinia graminis f. sp. tritici]